MESKQYTVVSKQSIELWIDSIGSCKVADEVFDILSEDVTYRLRDWIHNSVKYMKHSKRTCLTVDDLNFALKEGNTEPLFGHGGSDELSFKAFHTKEGSKVCYLDEKDLNLRETALESSLPVEPGETGLKASWLVLEGHSCSPGKTKDESRNPLMEPSACYLQNITASIIGKSCQLRKIALCDLKTNKKLQIIIPHLVSFCSSQIKQHTAKDTFVQVATYILSTIDALVQNPSVVLAPYVVQLAKIMLFILIEAKVPVTKWFIKDKASVVLALLSRRNCNTCNSLKEQLLKSYTESFNDTTKPISYLYGAIMGIKELGTNALYHGIYPKAREKLKLIDAKMCANILSQSEKKELIVVLNALTEALTLLYTPRVESCPAVVHRRKSQSFSYLHRELIDVAGESFLMRCLNLNQYHSPAKNFNQPNQTTQISNKNNLNVNGALSITQKISLDDAVMDIDQTTLTDNNSSNRNSKEKLVHEKNYTLQCTVGNISIISKWKPKLKREINIDDDGESTVFDQLPTMHRVPAKKKLLRGNHISFAKKKKMSDLLSQISIQLPSV